MSVKGLGEGVRVKIWRDGEPREISLPLIAAPDVPPRNKLETSSRSPIPGLILSTVNPAVIDEYNLAIMAKGVVVDDPGQFGLRAGLRAGDILLSINDLPAGNSADAARMLEEARGRLALEIQRGSRRMVMRFRL